MLQFTTKANTLKQLEQCLKSAEVLPQISITNAYWNSKKEVVLNRIQHMGWNHIPLIVRSSAKCEDTHIESMAGRFVSVLNVNGEIEIKAAIDKVISSYINYDQENQVLIQPMLQNVALCGVAFSIDPNNGGNYIVINYDELSKSTESVTSGMSNDLKTFYYFRGSEHNAGEPMNRIIELIIELESIFNLKQLDIEFAIDNENRLYLMQVRPLAIKIAIPDIINQKEILYRISDKIKNSKGHKPYLYGEKTVYGVMPDWNPAEIIGIRPRNLAITLYKELVTDQIWAYQRDNYGYKNLRSFPLLIDLGGFPYIDVRVSFNSFLPKKLNDEISEKLVNYYINRLVNHKNYHDKVEFEIIFSCFTFDLDQRIKILSNYGFTDNEIESIFSSLKELTNKIIDDKDGFLRMDIEKIRLLEFRRRSIIDSTLDKVSKIYWLLEDCKRYGTLPFAGLARGGFIAVQMLLSLKNMKIITDSEYNNFMCELDTVSSEMKLDFSNMEKQSFMEKYGHLRPGTYDILSNRYDEDDGKYFDFTYQKKYAAGERNRKFSLSLKQLNIIKDLLINHGLHYDVLTLFDFIKLAIESREYSKFVFTKNLSAAISIFGELGREHGFEKEELSYADISIIKKAYNSEMDIKKLLEESIKEGKIRHGNTLQLNLPPVLVEPEDVWSFYQLEFEPNFITLKKVLGHVVTVKEEKENYEQNIMFIESADPGFDWIFSKNISGFVTMYGGANSHMAIRAAELSIPAVIGVGETKYNQYSKADILEIDCVGKCIRIIA